MRKPIRRPNVPVRYIYRIWVTRKDGRRDYARDHGLRAWRIPVEDP